MENRNFGIKNSDKIISILEKYLGSESIHNLKIRKYHRNVETSKFKELHIHFEDLYNQSYERIDEIAERIRILGALAKGTYREYLDLSIINEDPDMETDAPTMVERLVEDKETIIRAMREDIETISGYGDVGTEDLLTGMIQVYEKDVWMLRSMT